MANIRILGLVVSYRAIGQKVNYYIASVEVSSSPGIRLNYSTARQQSVCRIARFLVKYRTAGLCISCSTVGKKVSKGKFRVTSKLTHFKGSPYIAKPGASHCIARKRETSEVQILSAK